MKFQLKFALYLPHLKSFELIHFRRRLRCVDCQFYREPERYHDLPKRTETDRNGTETDFLGYRKGVSGYRNGLSVY